MKKITAIKNVRRRKKIIRAIKKILGLQKKQFMLDLAKAANAYNMTIRGAIVVGAHYFREYEEYKKLGVNNFVLIEPGSDSYALLKKEFSSTFIKLYNVACGSEEGEKQMYIETANEGQSNSLLEPDNHLKLYSHIVFPGREKVKVRPLDNLEFNRFQYNFLSIDTQGYELEVLKGAVSTLPYIDYIMAEVNQVGASMYKGSADIKQLDSFLAEHGFRRPETPVWINDAYSDAIYIRK